MNKAPIFKTNRTPSKISYFLPIVIEFIAIFVAKQASDSYSGSCGSSYPSAIPTLIIALVGIVFAIIPLRQVFNHTNLSKKIFAIILLLVSILLGLIAIFSESFHFCF